MSTTFLNWAPVRARRQFLLGSLSLIFATVLLTIPATAEGQVTETPNRWIRGVAQVTLDRNGKSKISFNPQRCRELGPDLCEFFRTHEYGHVNLQHLERGVAARRAEAEADLWAAKHASPSAVQAAKQFFLSGKGGSRIHGTPQERARRMDVGLSSQKTSSTIQTSVTQGTRRVSKIPPKSYSATSKQLVRQRVKPSQTATKTVRHVVLSPPKVSKSSRRTSSGYVPRGDFLNPR